MAEDGEKKLDLRFNFIKDKISAAFPKLAGPKLDKLLSTDEIR